MTPTFTWQRNNDKASGEDTKPSIIFYLVDSETFILRKSKLPGSFLIILSTISFSGDPDDYFAIKTLKASNIKIVFTGVVH